MNHQIHTVRIQITGADVWRSLKRITDLEIPVFHVTQEEPLMLSLEIPQQEYRWVEKLLQKSGDRVLLRRGSHAAKWLLFLRTRKNLVSGLLTIAILTVLLPTRILFVDVEGAQRVSEKRILEAAEIAGIQFFASRKDVRSERMKNTLLALLPELQWAGINTYGCRAVISVKEKVPPEPNQQPYYVSNILAVRDGVVLSVNADQGSILCQEGQTVQRGQLLISGYTDCGFCLRATRAVGEVYAQTVRSLHTVTPDTRQIRAGQGSTRKKYSLVIGKKRIFLRNDSGIWDGTCGRISAEYTLTLPGGHSLPIRLCVDILQSAPLHSERFSRLDAQALLAKAAEDYLHSDMIAGRIIDSSRTNRSTSGLLIMDGQYLCTEMIGREHREQIGDLYGQNN